MKSVRLFLIVLGIAGSVGAMSIALALVPSVQRRILLRSLAAPGVRIEVTEVSAGFSGVVLSGLQWERGGVTVQLGRLESDYSLWQLLAHRRLNIQAITVSGVQVDASRLSRAGGKAALIGTPAAAPGLLAQLRLPVELVLGEFRLEGRASLPAAQGGPPLQADYQVSGGKFAPGREGTLLLMATVKSPQAEGGVAALHAQMLLRATPTVDRTFSRIGVTAVVDAEGKSFAEQNQLKITAELRHDAAGEDYTVSVDTLLRGTAENVLAAHAALPDGKSEFAGDWTMKARTAQAEPFFLGGALPDFDVRGSGRFTFNPVQGAASLQGILEGDASRLEAIEPALRAIGAVSLQTRFDLAAIDGIVRLNQIDLRVGGDHPVLDLQAARAVEINLNERRLQVGGSVPGEALNLTLHGLPLAWVRPFISSVDVAGGMLTGRLALTGEADRLLLKVVQPLQIDQMTVVQRGVPLLTRAEVSLSLDAVLTRHELQANITEFVLRTPAGDAVKALGSVSLPVGPNPSVSVLASYTADLPALLGPWLAIGPVRTVGEADFTVAGERIELRRLTVTGTDAAGQSLLNLAAARPFTYDAAARRLSTAGGSGPAELLRFTLDQLPLGPFMPARSGSKLEGRIEHGEFVLSGEGDKLTVRAPAPVRLSGVSLQQDGSALLTALSFRASPVVELAGLAETRVQTGEVGVFTAAGDSLMTFQGEAVHSAATGMRASLTFNVEVPVLVSQPLFAGTSPVSSGRASGEIRAALGSVRQVEARLTLNGLVTSDGKQTLPVANLSLRAVAQSDGRLSLQAPLLMDRGGQRSDLNLSLELTPAGRGFGMEGKLTGDHVELEDALSLLGVFTGALNAEGNARVRPAPDGKGAADTEAAWSRFGGRLALDIKSVTRGSEWSMTGLAGQVVADPSRIALQRLEADFGGNSRLTVEGGINFKPGAQPYGLAGDFSLTEFDAGRLFKALEPGKPATIEGRFTVAGHLSGGGGTLRDTLQRTRGKLELTGRQGVFRGLQRTSNKLSMTSKAVELGASVLGSLFGSEKATKAAEKIAGQAYFVDQLAQSIGELNYDQLTVRLARGDSLDVELKDFSLVSPEIRLIGKGVVAYRPDLPWLAQPLDASLSLAARGKIEQLLGKLRLLDGTQDDLGYAKAREPITLGGTLAKPDPSAFFTRIVTAKFLDAP